MDAEKSQKIYEGDENVQNKLAQEVVEDKLAEKAGRSPFSTSQINTFSTGEQENQEQKDVQKGMAKRMLLKSAHQEDFSETNILENQLLCKRIKLIDEQHANEGRSSNGKIGEDYLAGTSNTVDETVENVVTDASPDSDVFISNAFCTQHDLTPEGDDFVQEIHVKNEHSQKVPILLPEHTPGFPNNETTIGCITSHTKNDLECKTCEDTFAAPPDLQKHIEESHSQQTHSMNPHCISQSKHTSTFQMRVKQMSGKVRYFCDLCGFQSFEEELLRTHFLGKTHLRRQNLAARGGFVKILTKKAFHKKQHYPVKEKNVRTIVALNKPKIWSAVSNQLRTSNSKTKNVKASCKLFVEMVPSKNNFPEIAESITNEETFMCNVDQNSDAQAEKPDTSGSSDCNPHISEPSEGGQERFSNLNPIGIFVGLHHKKPILSRRETFKKSGSFRLNQQIKRRYHLLGMSRRSKPDSSLKHSIRGEISHSDSSQVKDLQIKSDDNPLCKAASEMQAVDPDGTNPGSSVILELENFPKKVVNMQKSLNPCTPCLFTLQKSEGLELDVDRINSEEAKFHCQSCGYFCATREGIELHCQNNRNNMSNCPHCSSFAPNDISLGRHLRDKHGVSHYCVTCHMYFLSEEEMTVHNATEQHMSSLAQETTAQQLESDLIQQTSPTTVESNSLPMVEEVKIQQEMPKPSIVHPGHELQESVLSKSQFQCKKCFYKTRSPSVFTRHIKLRHAQEYHFLCKACNLYSLSKEGMEKHIKRSKHLENARKNNIGLRFEECIERVCVGISESKKVTDASFYGTIKAPPEIEGLPYCSLENASINKELFSSGETTKDSKLILGTVQKRGRPKGTISRTCPHCGLLASSVTNLTVHIRRKHSHQYSYLCKVCNYYTVTKGDMERHCATKKHKSRLEAGGVENVEIIVCPEGGNNENSSKKINSPIGALNESVDHSNKSSHSESVVLERQGSTIPIQVENVIQIPELDINRSSSEKKQYIIAKPDNISQHTDFLVQTGLASANDNKCAHCEFVAHSFSSLDMHIKRKHTKEFEYYCMACDYYAVTRREMIRHAATEKHKIKRQSYMCTSGEETDALEIAKEVAIGSEEEQQPTEEFQIIASETKHKNNMEKSLKKQNTQKVKEFPNYLAAEGYVTSKMHRQGYVFDAEDVEIENRTDQNIVNAVSEENVQKDVRLGEIITLKETIDCALRDHIDDQDTEKSELPFTMESGNGNITFIEGSPTLSVVENKEKLGEDIDKAYKNTEIPDEEVKIAETQLSVLSETCSILQQQTVVENIEKNFQNMHNLQEQKSIPQSSATAEEDTLMDSQHEAEISLNNIWGADGSAIESVQESNETLDAFTSSADKLKEGLVVQNCGSFDSSIVKLKSHQDGCEPNAITDVQNLSGLNVYEKALRMDAPQGSAKRKKCEGLPPGESTRIRCDDCGFLADGLSGLNVHIAMKHPSKEKHFHCLLCGKSFYTESSLHQHLASAGHMRNEQASVEELPEGGATFKCVKCTEPFDSEQNLFLHIKEQHEEMLREVNKYIVEDTEQINREREENKGNICKYCGKMCRSSNSMAFLSHIRTHTGSKPFKCKICHFATAQLGDARNHVKRHLGMREYKCHVCGMAFVMKKHLNTHLLGKHGVGTPKERKFTCPLCDRSFTEKWAMNNHMKLHTGEKPYKCSWPTCHYSFLTVSAMKDHYRTHTGEKSFLCDLCGFAGGTRHALTKHRRQHTGEKPFKCDECNFASTTQSHLTRHKRVHTGEKPYRCPWCDYRSNCAENIRKHILHTDKHEGVKMYNCPKCEYGTNIPVEFRNHLKELHPDIENPDLAYLHAGIVSKSYECRLKGQGATFVETTSPFTKAALEEISSVSDKVLHTRRRHPQSSEQVQQVIIIQGYDSDFAMDASVEETAAATLQTLAMAGQVARVVNITEDGQVITASQNGSHVSSMIPGQILTEHLSDGKTQVVVVEGPLGGTGMEDAVSIDTASDPCNTIVQQIMTQKMLDLPLITRVHSPESTSALNALLCAVTELGEAENKAEDLDREQLHHKEVTQTSDPEPDFVSNDNVSEETQIFHDVQTSELETESMEVVTQLVHPSTIIASQERGQVAFKKMVEGVLQFAVCDSSAADQLMKEGVTQVILNEEGTIHMVAREGSQIIMQEAGSHTLSVQSEHMDLVGSDGKISQIIVTEEIVEAMVQDSNSNFSDGATHYIVTGIPQETEDESGIYSHTVIETNEPQEILQDSPVLNSNNISSSGNDEHLASMVIYTEDGSQTAAIQSQTDSNEL
ncbi:zinc finger protein 407 [Anolis carolinensis]|uniref:zinc finger protein 407 n=1 Tax=Anolis carolinensis TaxID=28377 RepID=UPI002F2B1A9D